MKGRKKHIEYPKKISEKTEAESYEKEIEWSKMNKPS
jgi:hypothetical protein